MNKFMLIFLIILMSPARAEVYKCVLNDKTVYQPDPCPSTAVKQAEIIIEKPSPAKAAEAETKLKAWQDDFSRREEEERHAQKERQAELDKQTELNALYRSARAQEELAEVARNPIIINRPYVVNPHFSPYQHPWGYGFGFDQPHRYDFGMPQQQQHHQRLLSK